MFLTSQSLKSCLNNSSEYPNSFFSWSQEVIGAELLKDVSSLQLSKDTDRHRKKILKQSMYGYTDSDGSLCGRS